MCNNEITMKEKKRIHDHFYGLVSRKCLKFVTLFCMFNMFYLPPFFCFYSFFSFFLSFFLNTTLAQPFLQYTIPSVEEVVKFYKIIFTLLSKSEPFVVVSIWKKKKKLRDTNINFLFYNEKYYVILYSLRMLYIYCWHKGSLSQCWKFNIFKVGIQLHETSWLWFFLCMCCWNCKYYYLKIIEWMKILK